MKEREKERERKGERERRRDGEREREREGEREEGRERMCEGSEREKMWIGRRRGFPY